MGIIPFSFNSCQVPGGFSSRLKTDLDSFCVLPNQKLPAAKLYGVPTDLGSPFVQSKLVLNGSSSSDISQKLDAATIVPDELILLVDNDCIKKEPSPSFLSEVIGKDRNESLKVQPYKYEVSPHENVESLEEVMNAQECLIGASYNKTYQLSSTNVYDDTLAYEQNYLGAINSENSFNHYFNEDKSLGPEDEVVVAVVDSGVAYDHSEIINHMYKDENGYVVGYNGVTESTDPQNLYDVAPNSHGTHIAGIIAAETNNTNGIAGIASQGVRIMPIRVFENSSESGFTTDTLSVVRGILWAAENGADVMNISLEMQTTGGSVQDVIFEQAINTAVGTYGVFVTLAAGNAADNNGQEINDQFYIAPAAYGDKSGVITVAAIDAYTGSKSDFSHYSTQYVEIAAPGSDSSANGILSLAIPSEVGDLYTYLEGTSQAAPMVAAAGALAVGLIEKNTGTKPSPAAVEQLILNGAHANVNLSSYVAGGKSLDLLGLVSQVYASYPETTPQGYIASNECQ